MDLNVSGIAALFGLGYIIGLKYAAIIRKSASSKFHIKLYCCYLFPIL